MVIYGGSERLPRGVRGWITVYFGAAEAGASRHRAYADGDNNRRRRSTGSARSGKRAAQHLWPGLSRARHRHYPRERQRIAGRSGSRAPHKTNKSVNPGEGVGGGRSAQMKSYRGARARDP